MELVCPTLSETGKVVCDQHIHLQNIYSLKTVFFCKAFKVKRICSDINIDGENKSPCLHNMMTRILDFFLNYDSHILATDIFMHL